MEYARLASSGLVISRIGIGCLAFGTSSWRSWVLDEQETRSLIRAAVDAGINFFDTADAYSNGRSEEVVGRALREIARRDEIVIATKVAQPMSDRPNMRGASRKHLVQGCEASLRRLGVEAIDLYQLHHDDLDVPLDETLHALDLLVRQGKVRYIGASSMQAWRLQKALSVSERRGWARFVSHQSHYNLLYREEEREMLPQCEAEGVGVLPWSPLARGLLARPPTSATCRAQDDAAIARLYHHPSDDAVLEATRAVAARRGVVIAEVALAWLLGRPAVVAPLVGVTRKAHVETAIRALDLRLTAEECEELSAPYQPHPVKQA